MCTSKIKNFVFSHLVPFVLQDRYFEKLCILYADATECQISLEDLNVVSCKLLTVVGLIDYLSYSNNIPFVVAYWHTQNGVGLIARLQIHLAVKTCIL